VVGCCKNCKEHSFDSEELLSGYQKGFVYALPVAAAFDNPSWKYKASSISSVG
jgi:hypothetical protein